MQVEATPGIFGLLILFAIVAVVIIIAAKYGGRTLAIFLGVGLLVLVALGFGYLAAPRQVVHVTGHSTGYDVALPYGEQPIAHEPTDSHQLTNEQMWEYIYPRRIVLDGEGEAAKGATADSVTVAVAAEEVEPASSELTADDEPATEASPDALSPDAPSTERPRPDWVDNRPTRIGNVYREVISSGPYRDVSECHRELDKQLREVVRQRLSQLTSGRYRPSLERLGLGLDFVLREICRQEWIETVDASFGEMRQVHVLMEFDAATDKQLREAYREYEREFRVAEVGGIAGLSLGGLALLYGLFKVDTWTRGYYTKRLFFGVPAAIIGFFVLLWD